VGHDDGADDLAVRGVFGEAEAGVFEPFDAVLLEVVGLGVQGRALGFRRRFRGDDGGELGSGLLVEGQEGGLRDLCRRGPVGVGELEPRPVPRPALVEEVLLVAAGGSQQAETLVDFRVVAAVLGPGLAKPLPGPVVQPGQRRVAGEAQASRSNRDLGQSGFLRGLRGSRLGARLQHSLGAGRSVYVTPRAAEGRFPQHVCIAGEVASRFLGQTTADCLEVLKRVHVPSSFPSSCSGVTIEGVTSRWLSLTLRMWSNLLAFARCRQFEVSFSQHLGEPRLQFSYRQCLHGSSPCGK